MSAALLSLRGLSIPEQTEVETWDRLLSQVRKPVQEALAQVALEMGVSPATARRKYDAWRRQGIEGLLPYHAKSDVARSKLNGDFLEWMAQLTQEQQTFARAHQKFLATYREGRPIPGLDYLTGRNRLPQGFGASNIRKAMTKHATPFQLKAARVGLRAAASFRPLVRTTRVGMEPGMEYQMDDMKHNFKVMVLGQSQACEVLALHALDVASGCVPEMVLKPRVFAADDTRISLKEHEALFFVCHVLAQQGWHPGGCTLTMEAGTMTIRDEAVQEEIHLLTGRKVVIETGQGSNSSATAGQYHGASEGNFRRKAHLESWHNLLQSAESDVMQFLGQVGRNSRIDKPEELVGRESEARAVVRWMESVNLPAEVRESWQFGFLPWHHAEKLIWDVVGALNRRTQHTLEGWEQNGNVTTDFDLPGVGLVSMAEAQARMESITDPAQRECFKSGLQAKPRRMSPWEVWQRGQTKLLKFADHQIARVLWRARRSEPVRIGRDHEIEIMDKDISPDPLVYFALGYTPGEKFDAVVNPWKPEKLYLYDAHGLWVGAVELHGAVSRLDTTGMEEAVKRAARQQALLLRPLRQRAAAGTTAARLARMQANAGIVQAERNSTRADVAAQEDQRTEAMKALAGI